MGVHLVNGDLVGDGMLDPMQPEALLYKLTNKGPQLTGVEYVVIAEAWDAANEMPPVLMGQVFTSLAAPTVIKSPHFTISTSGPEIETPMAPSQLGIPRCL